VGVAGQRVAIEDGELVVDGHRVAEPYVDQDTIDGLYYGPVTVPQGTVLVMGDHREVSVDSRSYGPVPVSNVDGRRLATLWSPCRR
jgi:signal peptidase I